MDYFEQTMYWLLAGSKGAANRIRIIGKIKNKPMNLNELSKKTGLSYKTAQHHIELLLENNLIVKTGNRYGQVYFLSDQLKEKNESLKKMLETNNEMEEKK